MYRDILKKLETLGVKGQVKILTHKDGVLVRETPWMDNLVVSGSNTGRNLIAQRLAGDDSYTLEITHGALGLGDTAPANSDTALEDEQARTDPATVEVSNNVVDFRFFFADGDTPDGSYWEFGTFIDATLTPDSGQLFNRLVFGEAYVKATGEDSTVLVRFTITG